MSGHGEKLTRKQEQAISALLTESTVSKAAATIAIGEATLRRWLKREDFTTEYRTARRQVVEQSTARLQEATGQAVESLVASLQAQSESVRLRAAVAILDHAAKGVEIADFEERLSALEETLSR